MDVSVNIKIIILQICKRRIPGEKIFVNEVLNWKQ